jgi:hypothetical protein
MSRRCTLLGSESKRYSARNGAIFISAFPCTVTTRIVRWEWRHNSVGQSPKYPLRLNGTIGKSGHDKLLTSLVCFAPLLGTNASQNIFFTNRRWRRLFTLRARGSVPICTHSNT